MDEAHLYQISLENFRSIDRKVEVRLDGTVASKTAQIFFVNGVTAALELIKQGALTSRTDKVFHSDSAWQEMMDRGSAYRRSPKGGSLSGRGRPGARHVSMRKLIAEARDIASLSQRFEEEMTL
jgi:hypothetical protein